MSSAPSSILYIGSDTEFEEQVRSHCEKRPPLPPPLRVSYHPGCILEHSTRYPLTMVFFDATEVGLDLSQVIAEVCFIKRYQPLRRILFVALMANEDSNEASDLFLTVGFQYLFFKGCETEILLQDCLYFLGDDPLPAHGFAMAKDINKPIRAGFNASLAAMGTEDFLIETDILPREGYLEMELSPFPDLTASRFAVKERLESAQHYPMTYAYLMDYPFPGAWDAESSAFVLRDTVETWLDHNRDLLSAEKEVMHVASLNLELVKDLYAIRDELPFQLRVTSIISEYCSQLFQSPIIFVDFTDGEEEGQLGIPHIAALVDQLRNAVAKPFLVVSNSKSTTTALQKVLAYDRLLATTEGLSTSIIKGICSKLHAKRGPMSTARMVFAPGDGRRALDVACELTLSEISEHEVSFYFADEIPMFTVLHFELPLNFYATVVPTYRRLRQREGQTHYLALLHGMRAEQLNFLRQFINQAIYAPLSDYSGEKLREVMDVIYHAKVASAVASPPPAEEISTLVVESPPPTEATKRPTDPRIKGKTKL